MSSHKTTYCVLYNTRVCIRNITIPSLVVAKERHDLGTSGMCVGAGGIERRVNHRAPGSLEPLQRHCYNN